MTNQSSKPRSDSAFFAGFLSLFFLFGIGEALAGPPGNDRGGEPQEVRGVYFKYIADDFDNGRSVIEHVIEDTAAGTRWELKFPQGEPPGLASGQRVVARGRADRGQLFLGAEDISVTGPGDLTGMAGTATVSGEQKTLVIIADFNDAPVSCTASEVQDLMFTDPTGYHVDGLYQEMSEGAVNFPGTVVGPYAIGYNTTDSCDVARWANAAEEQAQARGVNVAAYPRKVYVLPSNNSCGWSGYGQVGGSPSRAWVFRCGLEDVYAHELGHNLGWGHAGAGSSAYGDKSGIMGMSGYNLRHANAPHRAQFGWLAPDSTATVTESGNYELTAIAADSSSAAGPQMLTFPKPDTNDDYYVSYRGPVGFDAGLQSYFRNTVTIHHFSGSGAAQTNLVAYLSAGQSYRDDVNGVTFTHSTSTDNSASVFIDFDGSGCQPVNPSVSVSPSSQSGSAGDSLTYQLSVANRDGTSCGSTSFSLVESVPASWSSSVTPGSFTLSPGATGTATLTVTSSSDAAAGSFDVSVGVNDAGGSGRSASGSGTYSVVASCTAAAPVISVSPSRQGAEAGSTLSYDITVRNSDSAACNASTFSLSSQVPSGWSGSVSPTSLTLTPGGSSAAVLTLSAPSTATAGDYPASVRAGDSSRSASDELVFEVTAAPDPAGDTEAPTVPTGLSASVKRKSVNVSWNAASDNVGVVGYRLYRDGVLAASVDVTSYSDKAGAAGSTYYVVAYDAAGNLSQASGTAVASGGSTGKGGKGGKK
jgi:hypothetical protein